MRWPEIIGLYLNRPLNYLHCTGQATYLIYCQTSNISHTLVGNEIVDHSDVVGYIFIFVLTATLLHEIRNILVWGLGAT